MESPITSSSRASTSSCDPSPSKFASLPIMAMKDKIVEKISENRVTLIVGETGCGLTSQLKEKLASSTISPGSKHDPSYLYSASKVCCCSSCLKWSLILFQCEVEMRLDITLVTPRSCLPAENSKIIFKTAGCSAGEMREKGVNALKYKAIILDEVHERSVESDLGSCLCEAVLLRKQRH
ncbi:DExH-box ATP-dependent RNA helicase DExH8 [Bienertia sinuspersici]